MASSHIQSDLEVCENVRRGQGTVARNMDITFLPCCQPTFLGRSDEIQMLAHARLTRAQQKKKTWIQRDSTAYSALEASVNDTTTLRDIDHRSDFWHTGTLEVYHNVMTKYCPKREHFSHASMVG